MTILGEFKKQSNPIRQPKKGIDLGGTFTFEPPKVDQARLKQLQSKMPAHIQAFALPKGMNTVDLVNGYRATGYR